MRFSSLEIYCIFFFHLIAVQKFNYLFSVLKMSLSIFTHCKWKLRI